jgi:hypothetical protein
MRVFVCLLHLKRRNISIIGSTRDDQLLLHSIVSVDELALADMLAASLSGSRPDLVAERILARRRGLLLALLVLVDAVGVQAGVELAGSLGVGEVAVGTSAVGSIAAHRHDRAVGLLASRVVRVWGRRYILLEWASGISAVREELAVHVDLLGTSDEGGTRGRRRVRAGALPILAANAEGTFLAGDIVDGLSASHELRRRRVTEGTLGLGTAGSELAGDLLELLLLCLFLGLLHGSILAASLRRSLNPLKQAVRTSNVTAHPVLLVRQRLGKVVGVSIVHLGTRRGHVSVVVVRGSTHVRTVKRRRGGTWTVGEWRHHLGLLLVHLVERHLLLRRDITDHAVRAERTSTHAVRLMTVVVHTASAVDVGRSVLSRRTPGGIPSELVDALRRLRAYPMQNVVWSSLHGLVDVAH